MNIYMQNQNEYKHTSQKFNTKKQEKVHNSAIIPNFYMAWQQLWI